MNKASFQSDPLLLLLYSEVQNIKWIEGQFLLKLKVHKGTAGRERMWTNRRNLQRKQILSTYTNPWANCVPHIQSCFMFHSIKRWVPLGSLPPVYGTAFRGRLAWNNWVTYSFLQKKKRLCCFLGCIKICLHCDGHMFAFVFLCFLIV